MMTNTQMGHRARRVLVGAMVCALFFGAERAEAKKVRIKLGTLAPEGSPWYNSIKRIGQRWKEASGGKVALKIYPGGVVGDEGDMVRKIRIGQLHAATVTGLGLGLVTRSSVSLQVPMLIRSYEELDHVRKNIAPKIARELENAGFVVLNWGDAGWAHFFSKVPARTPQDFRKLKLFTWAGDPESEKAWKAGDFLPVPMSATDVLSGLQTGLIDCLSTTPLYALTSQWFGVAKHMVKVNWTPLNGATIVSKKRWNKLKPEMQKRLLEISLEEGDRTKAEVRRLGDSAIKAMKARGLSVYSPTPKELVAWRAAAEKAYPTIRGKVVPAAFFDEVQALAKAYREKKQK